MSVPQTPARDLSSNTGTRCLEELAHTFATEVSAVTLLRGDFPPREAPFFRAAQGLRVSGPRTSGSRRSLRGGWRPSARSAALVVQTAWARPPRRSSCCLEVVAPGLAARERLRPPHGEGGRRGHHRGPAGEGRRRAPRRRVEGSGSRGRSGLGLLARPTSRPVVEELGGVGRCPRAAAASRWPPMPGWMPRRTKLKPRLRLPGGDPDVAGRGRRSSRLRWRGR